MTQKDYVWYASYGSNINKTRFLCYIQGGTPIGSSKREIGCRDQSPPKDEKVFQIPHQLYFAKESMRWQKQGVAFIDLESNKKFKTYSKMYLVTREQFFDIVSQENNIDHFEIDLDEVVKNGSQVIKEAWYGNLLFIDQLNGYPIFSFTSPLSLDFTEVKKPSEEYLKTIISGLKQELGLTNDTIYSYLSDVPGIQGHFSREALQAIISQAD